MCVGLSARLVSPEGNDAGQRAVGWVVGLEKTVTSFHEAILTPIVVKNLMLAPFQPYSIGVVVHSVLQMARRLKRSTSSRSGLTW